jgi:hypothetical protein
MATKDKSGKDASTLAARLIKHPEKATKKNVQTLAGSVLAQAPNVPKPKPKPRPKGGTSSTGARKK